MKPLLLICAAVAGAAALAVAEARPETTTTADETGSIAGTVSFDGKVPAAPGTVTVGAKEATGCCTSGGTDCIDKTDRSLLVDKSGSLCNVVVTLTVKGMETPVPDAPVVLDQKSCRFEPHVVVVPKGAEIQYKNSDSVNHNIHTYSKKNKTMNDNVQGGDARTQKLEKDESFEVKCDIHPWMLSSVYVTDSTHWAVTGRDGKFKLDGVPPGTYKLEYWHEKLGKGKTEEVTVTAGQSATLDFKVGEKKKKGGRKRR